MAFWRQEYSYHSPIPEILEKETFTLEELLDEEGVIQETKSANGKLLEYLSQPEQISSLLTYIVQPATPGKHSQAMSKGMFCNLSNHLHTLIRVCRALLPKVAFPACDADKPMETMISEMSPSLCRINLPCISD